MKLNEYISKLKENDLSTQEKGNIAELIADEYFANRGYERVSKHRVESLDETNYGIDGVYKKEDKYVVAEVKFGKTTLTGNSEDKQMNERWIKERLNDAVETVMAEEILRKGYIPVLVRVYSKTDITTHKLSAAGHIMEKVEL